MPNLDENNQSSITEFIKSYLPKHKQLALGTIGADNMPWVVCVNFTLDQKYNFIWKSLRTTEHSKNINRKPDISICVFSEREDIGDFGYYCRATAREVNDTEKLKRLLNIRYANAGKSIPSIDEFLGESEARIYYAEVDEAWINDDRHIKMSVDLKLLRETGAAQWEN